MKETEKHSLIMNAAATIFAKYGYKKTTVDEIVSAAGISKGLFYHYYTDKKQLYLCLYNTYVDILNTNIKKEVDTNETDFFERLKQISHIRIAFINQYPNLWGFLYSAYYEQHPDVAFEIKATNNSLIQASYTSSASNIDWSKLKKSISPDNAMKIVTWVAEGFVREINSDKLQVDENLYSEFDKYIDLLKTGMYDPEKQGGA